MPKNGLQGSVQLVVDKLTTGPESSEKTLIIDLTESSFHPILAVIFCSMNHKFVRGTVRILVNVALNTAHRTKAIYVTIKGYI